MKRKCCDNVASVEEVKEEGGELEEEEEVRVLETHRFRKLAPAHFTFKIQSFSMLSKSGVEKCESKAFDVQGYKWKLIVYPDGNKSQNGNNHISLYLAIANADSLSVGWEAEVVLRLFLFDQIRDRYLVRGDAEGGTSRYHEMKKEQGFSQFLSLAKFNNQSYGYLVNDTCMFGAEVFVYKRSHFRDCLSMVKVPATVKYTMRIENFSKIQPKYLYSDKFKAANGNWSLLVYPNGSSTEDYNCMSVFLCWRDNVSHPDGKVYAEFKVRLRDQIEGKHVELGGIKRWFSAAAAVFGWSRFILLDVLNKSKGFLMNDTCIIDAEMKVLGTTC